MAKTKLDVNKWLKEDMGFSDEEIKAGNLVEVFTPRVDKLSDGYMRQSDYDRVQNEAKVEIKKQADELAASQARLDAEVAEWATVQAAGKGVTDKMRSDLEAAQTERLRLEQTLRKTAEAAGLDPEAVMKGITPAPAPKPEAQPPIDTSKFVDRDQYTRLANMALLVPAQLDRIQREHHDLTGEYLNPEELVAEVQARASTRGNQKSLELRDIWEEKHDIPAKREAKSKAKYDADITAAETRGREAAFSESALPGGGAAPVGKHAPIFQTGGAERKSVLQRPQPGQSSQAAVTALRTGKYRTAVPGAPVAAGKPA